MKRLGMVLLLSALAVGCGEQRMATSPDATALPGGIVAAISDGAHSGGNPDFFFLPPLQPSPRGNRNFDRGRFNPNLRPVVNICDGRDTTPTGECVKVLAAKNGKPAVFNAVRGWDGLPDWVDPEQYHVLWQTRDYGLVADGKHAYRILVKVGSRRLGFLDVVPVNQVLGALRITAGGQDVGWLDDWVVPIRFRIEQGALCYARADCAEFPAVTSTGGNFTLPGEEQGAVQAAVSIPAGAVLHGDVVTIVIEKEEPQYGEGETKRCLNTDLVQSAGCYHFSTYPELYQFHTDVRMEACVDPSGLTTDQANALELYKYNSTQGLVHLTPAEPTLINCPLPPPAPSPIGASSGFRAPANLAEAVWRGAGRLFANLLSPSELFAATMMFGTPPKGLGGSGGSFSDVGGAVASTAPGGIVGWGSTTMIFDGSSAEREDLLDPNGDTGEYVLVRNILQHLSGKTSDVRILYTDTCDPREDENLCFIAPSFDYLQPFFDMVNSIGTLTYADMSSVQLADYDVVIADFCSVSGWPNSETDVLRSYLSNGGRAMVLADNFCWVNDPSSETGEVSTAERANTVMAEFGVTFSGVELIEYGRVQIPSSDQTGLLAGVSNLSLWRKTPLVISHSFVPLVTWPWQGETADVLVAIREGTPTPVPAPRPTVLARAPTSGRLPTVAPKPAGAAPGQTQAALSAARGRVLVTRH